MNTIELIRAEIERRIKQNEVLPHRYIRLDEDKQLLSFLSTLESGKPKQEELEEEIREYMSNDDNNPYDWDWRDKRDCARHFAQWGAEHRGSSEIPKDLGEAAGDYASDSTGFIDMTAYRAFPELRESEDEQALRIIKKRMCYDPVPISDEDRRIVENWLEKQKESLHIPETCKENDDSLISKDERIRTQLLDFLEHLHSQGKSMDFDVWSKVDCAHWILWIEKQKEQKSRIDACGFPLREEGESACSYLERCLAPEMRRVWYEACDEIKKAIFQECEKQKEQKSLNISAASEWLKEHVCNYMNSEYNKFHKCVEYDGSIDKERLINDFEEAMQKEQDECPEYCVRSHCMGCSIYEKQKEKPSIFPPGFGEVRWNPISSVQQKPVEWNLPEDFEEAVYKIANFISPFNSNEELRKVSHRFAEQLLSIAKKDEQKPAEWSEEDDQLIGFIFDLLNDLFWRKDWAMSKEECLERLKSLRPQNLPTWERDIPETHDPYTWFVRNGYRISIDDLWKKLPKKRERNEIPTEH